MSLLPLLEIKQIWLIRGILKEWEWIPRVVSTEDGEARAKESEVLFTEVSAKSDYNVQNLFKTLATHLTGSDATTFNDTRQPSASTGDNSNFHK